MNRLWRSSGVRLVWMTLCCLAICGCGMTPKRASEVPHPQQSHVETLADRLMSQINTEEKCWVQILSLKKPKADLEVLAQWHVRLSERLVAEADDTVLTALLAHAIAHHELHHVRTGGIVDGVIGVASVIPALVSPVVGLVSLTVGEATSRAASSGIGAVQERRADGQAVVYLRSLGYSVDDYIRTLEFMDMHRFKEKTGRTTTKKFSHRIRELRHAVLSQVTILGIPKKP